MSLYLYIAVSDSMVCMNLVDVVHAERSVIAKHRVVYVLIGSRRDTKYEESFY